MKTKKSFWSEVGDVLSILWNVFCSIVATIYTWVLTWKIKTIKKIIGIGITVVASVALAFEVIFAILLLGDPYQVSYIIQTICGVSIFNYITEYQYYGFVLGGVIADLAGLTLALWFGIYLGWRKNYFVKPKKAWMYVVFLWFAGVAMVCVSVFYMLPSVAPLIQEIHDKHRYYHSEIYGQKQAYSSKNSYDKTGYIDMQNFMNERHKEMGRYTDGENSWFVTW